MNPNITLQYVQHHWLSLLKFEYDVFSDQRLDSTSRNTIVKDVFGSDFDMIKIIFFALVKIAFLFLKMMVF